MEDRPNTRSCKGKELSLNPVKENHQIGHSGVSSPVCSSADEGRGERHNAKAQYESLRNSTSSQNGPSLGNPGESYSTLVTVEKVGQIPYNTTRRLSKSNTFYDVLSERDECKR